MNGDILTKTKPELT